MVPFVSWVVLAGILSTQVGDPLTHHQQGFLHAASFDGLSGTSLVVVLHAKDQEVASRVTGRGKDNSIHSKKLMHEAITKGPMVLCVASLATLCSPKSGPYHTDNLARVM